MCSDRTAKAAVTRCTEACPAEATITGDRDQLIVEAKKRIAENPGKYFPQVYGLEEAGGTSVFFLSDVPFDKIGYRTNIPHRKMPEYTWAVLQFIPDITVVGGVLLGGVYWITHRREAVAAVEGQGKETR
jgi:formate dehydrogenase iron-sulfur subunit